MSLPASNPAALETARAEIARGRAALDESIGRNIDSTPDGQKAIALLLATLGGLVFQFGDRPLATRLFAEAFRLSPERRYLSSYTALRLVESRAFMTFVSIVGLPGGLLRMVASTLASLTRTGIAEMRHLTRTRHISTSDVPGAVRALLESLLVVPLALFTFILAVVSLALHIVSKIVGAPVLPLTPFAVRLLRRRSAREVAGGPDLTRLRDLVGALQAFTE